MQLRCQEGGDPCSVWEGGQEQGSQSRSHGGWSTTGRRRRHLRGEAVDGWGGGQPCFLAWMY